MEKRHILSETKKNKEKGKTYRNAAKRKGNTYIIHILAKKEWKRLGLDRFA